MTSLEYYIERIRNDVGAFILRIGLIVMPEGVIKQRLIRSWNDVLDNVIEECQRIIDNENKS